MAFFGLFGKKKGEVRPVVPVPPAAPQVPKPPTPPAAQTAALAHSTTESGEVKPPQHVDDFGFVAKEAPAGLEMPELELPELPEFEKKEVEGAIEKVSMLEKMKIGEEAEIPKPAEIPSELPEIGAELPKPAPTTVLEEVEEPFEMKPTPKVRGPVYVRSDQFKEIKGSIIILRDSLLKSEETLSILGEIRTREDSAYEAWHSAAESIQRKLSYIDKTLFEKHA